MWDKGCCIPHAVTFAICQDKEAMEGAKHNETIATEYEELRPPSFKMKNAFKKF
jgi:hypothetical protein